MDPPRIVVYKNDSIGKMIIYMVEDGSYDYIFEPVDGAHYDEAKRWAKEQMQIFLDNLEKIKKLVEG